MTPRLGILFVTHFNFISNGMCVLWLLSDGYVNVEDILDLPEARNKTEQDVRNIVRNDNKERFSLRESCGILQIKATQGHSLEVVLYSILYK